MRNKITTTLGLLLSSLAFSCGSSAEKEHACTTIGCLDRFTLSLSLPSGAKPDIAVDLVVDGVAISCPAPAAQSWITCSNNVNATVVEDQKCADVQQGSAVTHTCTGTGIFHLTIAISGTPKSVSYTSTRNGTVVGQDTLSPVYESQYPNGLDCGPVCKQASAAVTLP